MNYHAEIVFCFVLFVCFLKQDLCSLGLLSTQIPLASALLTLGLQVWTITLANAGTTGMDYRSWYAGTTGMDYHRC